MNWWCARWCSRKWNVVVRMGKAAEPVGGELVELAVGKQHVVRALVHGAAELVLGGTDGDDRQHGHGNAQPPRDLARHGEMIEVDGGADRDGEDDVDTGEVGPVGDVIADLEGLGLFRRLGSAARVPGCPPRRFAPPSWLPLLLLPPFLSFSQNSPTPPNTQHNAELSDHFDRTIIADPTQSPGATIHVPSAIQPGVPRGAPRQGFLVFITSVKNCILGLANRSRRIA